MSATFKECVLDNLWFKILSLISVLLLISSFLMPPTGVIDPSVMAGIGEIFAWGALFTVLKAIDKGKTASITHGNTTIEVKKENEEELDTD
jgi:hypothetical protein